MFYVNQLRDCSMGETPATFHDKYETLEQPWGSGAEAEFWKLSITGGKVNHKRGEVGFVCLFVWCVGFFFYFLFWGSVSLLALKLEILLLQLCWDERHWTPNPVTKLVTFSTLIRFFNPFTSAADHFHPFWLSSSYPHHPAADPVFSRLLPTRRLPQQPGSVLWKRARGPESWDGACRTAML